MTGPPLGPMLPLEEKKDAPNLFSPRVINRDFSSLMRQHCLVSAAPPPRISVTALALVDANELKKREKRKCLLTPRNATPPRNETEDTHAQQEQDQKEKKES